MQMYSKKPIKFGNLLYNLQETEMVRVICSSKHIDLQGSAMSWESNKVYKYMLALECKGITASNGVLTVYL